MSDSGRYSPPVNAQRTYDRYHTMDKEGSGPNCVSCRDTGVLRVVSGTRSCGCEVGKRRAAGETP